MKRLSAYAEALGLELHGSAASLAIEEVSNNSKLASKEPWLFCAVPGFKRDGHDFVREAVQNGAVAAVVERKPEGLPEDFPLLFVENPHLAWALACETRFDRPADSLILSGVTGTNGKTTIAFLLRALIEGALKRRCGLLSTVLYDSCGAVKKDSTHTTPDAYMLQRLLAEMRDNGCSHAAMELSSHGLHQRRCGSAKFKTAIFTNLTGDHLDYHKDMESYYQAKKLMFTESLAPDGAAIINTDDSYGARLLNELSKTIPKERLLRCSKDDRKAQCRLKSMHISDRHSEVELSLLGHNLKFKSPLIGEYNVFNMAAAAASALYLGASPELVMEVLSTAKGAPGRLEGFRLPSGALAFVDYAHTDDALFRVLSALRPLCHGNLITLFGCGGDRDVTKRPRMGAVASRLSEVCILTSDNPRSEDPVEIIAQIRKGVNHGVRCLEIPERREALEEGVRMSLAGDILLVAGKGHENYQDAKGVKIHFDDREILLSLGALPLNEEPAS